MRSAAAVVVYGIAFYAGGVLAINLGLVRPMDVFLFMFIMAFTPLAGWATYYLTLPMDKRQKLSASVLKRVGLAALAFAVSLVAVSYLGQPLAMLGVPYVYYVFVMPIIVFLVPFAVFWVIARKTLEAPGIKPPDTRLFLLTVTSVVTIGTLALMAPLTLSGIVGTEYMAVATIPLAVISATLVVIDAVVLTRWLMRKKQGQQKTKPKPLVL